MAPTKNEIDLVWQFESTSMIPVAGVVLTTFVVLFALVWASISICACCGKSAEQRRKMLQDEADAAVVPPPDPPSRSSRDILVFDAPSGKHILRRKGEESGSGTGAPTTATAATKKEKDASPTKTSAEKEKPPPPKKEIAKKEATTTVQSKTVQGKAKKAEVPEEHQTFVPEENVHAYRTIGAVDSAVFDKSGKRAYWTGHTNPRSSGDPHHRPSAIDPSMKFVDDENWARYKTLNLADSKVFDKTKVVKIEPEKTKSEDRKPLRIEEKSKSKTKPSEFVTVPRA